MSVERAFYRQNTLNDDLITLALVFSSPSLDDYDMLNHLNLGTVGRARVGPGRGFLDRIRHLHGCRFMLL